MAKHQSSRLSWLAAAFGAQKDKIAGLWGRLSDMRGSAATNPRIFTKFLSLLDQIAAAKGEEEDIVSEIEAIERKHKFNRKKGYLKRAVPSQAQYAQENDADRKPNHRLLGLFAWFYLMTRKPSKP